MEYGTKGIYLNHNLTNAMWVLELKYNIYETYENFFLKTYFGFSLTRYMSVANAEI